LLVVTEDDELPPSIRPQIVQAAERSNRTLIVVANAPGQDQLSWEDFLESFGGVVPSWRALDGTYLSQLETAAKNAKPEGFGGKPGASSSLWLQMDWNFASQERSGGSVLRSAARR
jgi:hypothetical protein